MQLNGRHALAAGAILAGLVVHASTPVASAHGRSRREFSAKLESFNEVPSLSTEARGSFRAKLNRDKDALRYKLSYSGMTGTVTQSHIHLGQKHTNGGVMVFLCQAASTDPTGLAPTCPATEGSVEATLTAANIIGPGGQGVPAGAFDEFVEALREDAAYVNVHTTMFGGGEIRGQVKEDD